MQYKSTIVLIFENFLWIVYATWAIWRWFLTILDFNSVCFHNFNHFHSVKISTMVVSYSIHDGNCYNWIVIVYVLIIVLIFIVYGIWNDHRADFCVNKCCAIFSRWVLQHCTGFARLVWGRLRVHRAFVYSDWSVCYACFFPLLPSLTLLLSFLWTSCTACPARWQRL